jgi:hypothetical protein
MRVDEDEEYKKYTLRLYARLHRIEEVSIRTIAEEAIEANSESSSITIVSLSDDSLSDVNIDKDDIKTYHSIEVGSKRFEVPEQTPKALKIWQKVLKQHEDKTAKNLELLRQVEPDKDYLGVVKTKCGAVSRIEMPIRSRERGEVMRRLLLLMITEDYLYSQVGRISTYLKDAKAVVDELSDGLWLDHVSNPDAEEFLKGKGTRRIVPSQKYRRTPN